MAGELNTKQLETGILSPDSDGRALFGADVLNAATFLTAVADGAITNAALASGAGVAALLGAGLGGSESITKTAVAETVIVVADGAKDRACLVVVVVDEVFNDDGGNQSVLEIGEEGNVNLCMANTVLIDAAANSVWVFAFTNTATNAITTTSTAATGASTGGATVTVIGIPTT